MNLSVNVPIGICMVDIEMYVVRVSEYIHKIISFIKITHEKINDHKITSIINFVNKLATISNVVINTENYKIINVLTCE